MKKLMLSIALCLFTAPVLADDAPAVLWNNNVNCKVPSFSYYDFSKAQPLQIINDVLSPGTTITMSAYNLGSGTIQIPGTPFTVEIHGLQYSNTIAGKATNYKTLFADYMLRQDGKVVAGVEVQEGAPASYSLLLADATMFDPTALEATVRRDADWAKGSAKPLADYIRQLDSTRQVIAESVTVSCAASKQ